ncbi:MAG: YicC family protein [Christensenellaceae bacterium]|jgi:uncharacterized protein (TIGR00255 family)|nr:YicC family protein [Christensenellaceae bacterium]
MLSMTGYGKGIAEADYGKCTVEIRAVNHRFLDFAFRLPRGFQFAEDLFRREISLVLKRGRLDVSLVYENSQLLDPEIKLNEPIAKLYIEIGKNLESLGLKNNLGVAELLKFPDVVSTNIGDSIDEKKQAQLIKEASQAALKELIKMRSEEGSRIEEDMRAKLHDISISINKISEIAPFVELEYRQKLFKRVTDMTSKLELINPARLEEELAYIIDKCNIDEEITRINGHIKHFHDIFLECGQIGKKLDFLTQELNREVNTIASKTNNATITKLTLHLKNYIEMLREQIQNIE